MNRLWPLLIAGSLAATPVATARDFLPSFTSRAPPEEVLRPTDIPSDEALESAGALISEISFDIFDIFATDTPAEDVTLFRLGNFLHNRTKQSTIARQLLFAAGEPYSRQKIEESERLLRSRNYLVDVRIYPIVYRDGRVEVRVRTRDVWTLKPGVSFGRSGGSNTFGVTIEESNLLGYGKQLSLAYGSTVDRTTKVLDYRDPQLFGSRWTLLTQLGSNSDGRKNALALERPFYALDSRWSAGVRWTDDRRIDPVYDLGNLTEKYRTNLRSGSVYYGYSEGLRDRWVTRWTAGVTYDDYQFESLPGSPNPTIVAASRKLIYPWIGYELAEDNYRNLENLNQIGRVEDLNLGWLANAKFGIASKQIGADRNSLVWSGALARNWALGESQIAELRAAISGRTEGSRPQNALVSVAARYFLRGAPSRLTYLSLQADVGTRLDADQRLTLGGDTGLRGYPLRYQAGSGRWIATAEQRFFSDWYPFRLVRVGGAVFFDIGRTFGDNPFGSNSIGTLRDVGFGLRIGQSRSGLGNVTHVNLAFPLNARGDIKRVQLVVETKTSF